MSNENALDVLAELYDEITSEPLPFAPTRSLKIAIDRAKTYLDSQTIECHACSVAAGGHSVKHLKPECPAGHP